MLGPEAGDPPVDKYVQRIPRPVGASAAGPPPWASVDVAQRRITMDGVRRAVAGRVGARYDAPSPDGRRSAVLVPFYVHDGEPYLIFTRRTEHLRTHQGQVSFPGGRIDPGETPVQAALREAHEEIGLAPEHVEVLGELDHLVTFSVGSFVVPIVGFIPELPRLTTNPVEVARLFSLPASELLHDDVFHQEDWGDGRPFTVPFFELEHETIWGATGRMLVNLFRLVLDV
ncbi:MAG: CoA pyrophosphatase [Acidimicrobiia bacterium]